jgi:hypothetical protein
MQQSAIEAACDGNIHYVPIGDGYNHDENAYCLCAPELEIIPGDLEQGIDVTFVYKHHGLNGCHWDDLPD